MAIGRVRNRALFTGQVQEGKYDMVQNIAERRKSRLFLAKSCSSVPQGCCVPARARRAVFALGGSQRDSFVWTSLQLDGLALPAVSQRLTNAPTDMPCSMTIAGCPPFAYQDLSGTIRSRSGQGAGDEDEVLGVSRRRAKPGRRSPSELNTLGACGFLH